MTTVPLLVACVTALVCGPMGRPRRVARPSDVPARDGRISTTRSRRRRWSIGLSLLLASTLMFGPLLAAGAVAAIAASSPTRRHLAMRAHRRSVDASLPEAVEMLILVVHAGLTPHQAVVMLAERAPLPVRPAFREVRRRSARGVQLADALRALPEVLGPGAGVVADTLAMAERHGTPIGTALEQLAFDVRERRMRHAEAESRKLPIRMSFPLVGCTLPSFVLIAIVPAVLAAMASLGDTGL